ncbi:hypothetical protein [Paenibacillus radicis (ex Xue et al. 2023)]|uniref:Uncharacterized protein n=1 Tax=Paenibacillus radicis (ex Xue et al. 2023) TaxID=2972489 RepID=A0ABT1YUM5_9BACL|nr:hypothetical protein [Paenibacillus radicis (ex Xue et al. 2023)]MCR8636045.1 hypothetical protein [Paenibacillus radicis (ex Xue et al. 2023)]
MARQVSSVPFGYVPDNEREEARGSLWVYDSFRDYGMQQLLRVVGLAEQRSMVKIVFYPLHEETLRRMGEKGAEPYYRRADRLEELLDEADPLINTHIDLWEGRRKKYTPMDTAFRFLAEKYKGPHFVYVTVDMANTIAAFDSFEEWIKKLRLFIDMKLSPSAALHPKLEAYVHRWDAVE